MVIPLLVCVRLLHSTDLFGEGKDDQVIVVGVCGVETNR